MVENIRTLCFPDDEKSCFACCPPIRPFDYEHIQYKNIIMRFLRENNEGFKREEREIISITGFSCWALGYLDDSHKLIGCLLHPAQNGGTDYRYRIDYGEKCRRENCREEKTFSELGRKDQEFWIHLVAGFDSFSYSSRRLNPLFQLMGWGKHLLSLIPLKERGKRFTKPSFFRAYPFFKTNISSRANAYLIDRLVREENIHILQENSFGSEFSMFVSDLEDYLSRVSTHFPGDPYVHLLDLDKDFSDFLRLSARIPRIKMEEAGRLKKIVNEATDIFRSKFT